jgi:alkylated DNA nucleotide flippase Atl1
VHRFFNVASIRKHLLSVIWVIFFVSDTQCHLHFHNTQSLENNQLICPVLSCYVDFCGTLCPAALLVFFFLAPRHARFLDHTQRRVTVGTTPLGRVIRSSQRPLPDNTQHTQQTNIHATGGIRTHDRSRRAAVDLRLRPRGHCQWRTEEWGLVSSIPPPRNSEVLTKLSRIPSSVEKYIRNNLIRIRVSLICKLSGTPDWRATAPRSPFSLPSVLN